MTDRHIMTPEEAAQLPMPTEATLEFSLCFRQWMYVGDDDTGTACIAAAVANGYLPREILDHAWAAHRGEEWLRNPRVAEKFKERGLRITELEQQLGYERAKRSQAESLVEKYDSRLTGIRVALTNAGLPEVERYPDEDVTEEERQLRTGGRVIGDERRARILADALEATRKRLASAEEQLADAWPEERKQAAIQAVRWHRLQGHGHWGHDIVDPSEIKPCPRCGAAVRIDAWASRWVAICDAEYCSWRGPGRATESAAIAAHNAECEKLVAR